MTKKNDVFGLFTGRVLGIPAVGMRIDFSSLNAIRASGLRCKCGNVLRDFAWNVIEDYSKNEDYRAFLIKAALRCTCNLDCEFQFRIDSDDFIFFHTPVFVFTENMAINGYFEVSEARIRNNNCYKGEKNRAPFNVFKAFCRNANNNTVGGTNWNDRFKLPYFDPPNIVVQGDQVVNPANTTWNGNVIFDWTIQKCNEYSSNLNITNLTRNIANKATFIEFDDNVENNEIMRSVTSEASRSELLAYKIFIESGNKPTTFPVDSNFAVMTSIGVTYVLLMRINGWTCVYVGKADKGVGNRWYDHNNVNFNGRGGTAHLMRSKGNPNNVTQAVDLLVRLVASKDSLPQDACLFIVSDYRMGDRNNEKWWLNAYQNLCSDNEKCIIVNTQGVGQFMYRFRSWTN